MEGVILFALCTWAVFSRHVDDGFVGRHLLTFAAIFSAGYVYSGDTTSFLIGYVLTILFMLYAVLRQYIKLACA